MRVTMASDVVHTASAHPYVDYALQVRAVLHAIAANEQLFTQLTAVTTV
jgi:hypothetical protein